MALRVPSEPMPVVGAKVGVPTPRGRSLTGAGFFAALIGQLPETWTWIETVGQFLQLGITVQGALPPPGSLAEQAANLCNHATGWQVGVKPNQARPKGALVKLELPIHISKVSPMVDGKPTRVRFVTKADGSKVRVASKGGKELGAVAPARKTAKKAK